MVAYNFTYTFIAIFYQESVLFKKEDVVNKYLIYIKVLLFDKI